MLASDFDFELPPERIAQHPARPRDAARLLSVGPALSDHRVTDLPSLLRAGDLLVVNDTRVIPAQLSATRGAARIGITLDRPRPDGTWHVLARNARRLKPGDTLHFDGADLSAVVAARHEDGSATLRFDHEGDGFRHALDRAGALALPPYIDRPDGPSVQDQEDYQTSFATHDGAVAAPTAGLHFTPKLVSALEAKGIGIARITLHVGAGTFLPMRTEHVRDHVIHAERGEVLAAEAARMNAAREAGGRVVAVGTTSLRLLETAVGSDGRIGAFSGDTSIFLLPGHHFRGADLLMTNFHLPRSTLFMLVCAFAGTERMRGAYAHAIAGGYRFYSYGDSSLLECQA